MTYANIDSCGEEDDVESTRRAFEEFMLAGTMSSTPKENKSTITTSRSKKKKKKKKSSLDSSAANSPGKFLTPNEKASDDTTTRPAAWAPLLARKQPVKKRDKKRHHQLLRSFNSKMQHTWFDIDDQLLSILQNVSNIRGRLPQEWKLLHFSDSAQVNVSEQEQDRQRDQWKYHGFLGKPKELSYAFHLHTADVELALSNDLMQHEKMLAGVRSLMSNLAECQESLGRVLDTLYTFHLEYNAQWEDNELSEHDNDNMHNHLDAVTDVFHMLSLELYRKQNLVLLILESTNDEILRIEASNNDYDASNNDYDSRQGGLQTVRMCCESWPRSSEESCIDEEYLSVMLKMTISRS